MLLGITRRGQHLPLAGVGSGHLRPGAAAAALRERARSAAKRRRSDHKLSELVGNLSHGEHRQIAIAMVFASEPKAPDAATSRHRALPRRAAAPTELLLALDRTSPSCSSSTTWMSRLPSPSG